MTRTYRWVELRYGLAQRLALTLLVLPLSATTQAEITVDGSLGSFRGPLAGPAFQIDAKLGKQVGTNLFHSFGAFNINHPQSATFTPNGSLGPIANVLGRVTGGSASTIDGVLRSTIPNANLFFFNPHGVAFGPHAQLDVPGSFHVSTADYLRLGDGVRFDAQPSAHDALLTTAPPAAFGFLSEQPAGISVRGSTIVLKEGKTLSLVGGDFDFVGTGLNSQGQPKSILGGPSGRINLASVASSGEVSLVGNDLGLRAFTQLGQIRLSRNGLIATDGAGGGRIYIRGGRLVADSASITANTFGDHDGKGIDIDIAGELKLDNDALIQAATAGTGAAGDIALKAGKLAVHNGARISVSTFGAGHGGDLTIHSSDTLLQGGDLEANTRGKSPNEPGLTRSGDAGDISVKTGRLTIKDGAQIVAGTFGPGRGGDLTIEANHILLEGEGGGFQSGLFAAAEGEDPNKFGLTGSGDAGDISVKTGRLTIKDGAQIVAGTFGPGRGGDLTIETDDLLLEGQGEKLFSGLFANTEGQRPNEPGLTRSGDAGDIRVTAQRLSVKDNGRITASTFGAGRGGNITVEADDMVLDSTSGLFASAQGRDPNEPSLTRSGDAGEIRVKAGQLAIKGGAQISANTIGPGKGGNLTVEAKDILLESEGGGFASALLTAAEGDGPNEPRLTRSGDAGDIRVKAEKLTVKDGALIAAATFGPGSSGNLIVEANDILLEGAGERFRSGLYASSFGSGRGGNIFVNAGNTRIHDGGIITSQSEGAGQSGNIALISRNHLELANDSTISVETTQADAGDINLNVGTLLHLRDNSAITTSVAGGQGEGGDITIDPTFVVLDGSRIVADAVRGRGGNINIIADHLFRTPDSLIRASSKLGIPGTVDIKSPDGDVSAGLLALPAHFIDAAAVLTRPCAERYAADAIRLIVRKYEVLPDSPYALRVYLPSAGSDPNFPSDASQSSGIPDLHARWDPRTYACAFDLE